MYPIVLMLAVTACYTVTSLSDKYAASGAKFNGHEFTFLMCSSMAVFIGVTLPFQELYFEWTWQSFAAIILVAASKIFEFEMNVLILRQLSAFELKAWLGISLFVSYFTDVFYGAALSALKLLCISAVTLGLVFIARSGRENKIQYRKIAIPLILYIASKYGYGLIIKSFTPYISPTMQLFPALAIVALITLPKAKPKEIFKKNPKGALKVVLARIPNAAGMIIENIVISISLANYAFIQPMILVTLFVIGLIRKESCSKLNLIGSIICVIGVAAFQIV